jgi:hypothetical protein
MNNETPPPIPPLPPDEFPDIPDEPPPLPPSAMPSSTPASPAPIPPGTSQQPGDSSQAAPRRGGAARERYERRKQQATPAARAAKAPSQRRQINVPQNVNLPKIPGGSRVLIGLIAAIAFVILVVYVLGRVRNTTLETQPNAVWLGTEWTNDDHTDDQIADLVKKLRDRQLGTVYAYVTYLQFNGTWRNDDKFDKVKTFVAQFKKAYPEADLYALIGVPTADAAHPPRLNDVNLQQQVADLSKRMINDYHFDGIFLDAEPVWDNDQDFLALLRGIRAAVGITTPISAAIPPDWSPANPTIPVPPLIEPGTEWKKEYKQSVALLVDHMAVMVFNSGLSSAADYEQWVAYQVNAYANAIGELNTKIDLLIAIPTFDNAPPGHDTAVENIDTAVQGIRAGLQQAGANASYVTGLAIYADWTTDDTEWASFQKDWLTK